MQIQHDRERFIDIGNYHYALVQYLVSKIFTEIHMVKTDQKRSTYE
jgi:hypothetical protein